MPRMTIRQIIEAHRLRAREKGYVIALNGVKRFFSKKHVHEWKKPEIDFTQLRTTEGIQFALCGEVCHCGARRIYEGSYSGWRELNNGNS